MLEVHGPLASHPFEAIGIKFRLSLTFLRAAFRPLGFDDRQRQAVLAPQNIIDESLAGRIGHPGDTELADVGAVRVPACFAEQHVDEQVASRRLTDVFDGNRLLARLS